MHEYHIFFNNPHSMSRDTKLKSTHTHTHTHTHTRARARAHIAEKFSRYLLALLINNIKCKK